MDSQCEPATHQDMSEWMKKVYDSQVHLLSFQLDGAYKDQFLQFLITLFPRQKQSTLERLLMALNKIPTHPIPTKDKPEIRPFNVTRASLAEIRQILNAFLLRVEPFFKDYPKPSLTQLFQQIQRKFLDLLYQQNRKELLDHLHTINPRLSLEKEKEKKILLYRFSSVQEFEIMPDAPIIINLLDFYNLGIMEEDIETLGVKKYSDLNQYIYISPIRYKLRSHNKQPIGLGEYLSKSKGAGGNIVGFQEYFGIKEDVKNPGTIGSIGGAILAFSDFGARDLIILHPQRTREDVPDFNTISLPTELQRGKIRPTITEYIPLDGCGPLVVEDTGYVTGPCADMGFVSKLHTIQVFHAGRLLRPYPNWAEINLVGDQDLLGFRVRLLRPNGTVCTLHEQWIINFVLEIFSHTNLLASLRRVE